MGRILVIHPQTGFLDLVKLVLEGAHDVEVFQDYHSAVNRLAEGVVFEAVLCGLQDAARTCEIFEKAIANSPGTRLILIAKDEAGFVSHCDLWNAFAQRKGLNASIGKEWLRDPCTTGQILALFRAPRASPGQESAVGAPEEDGPGLVAGETETRNLTHPFPLGSGEVIDGYRLTCAIGQGGFGTTWLAVNEATGKRVAVKFVQGEEQMPQELVALRKYVHVAFRSEHLLPVEHINYDSSRLWLVTPLADSLTGGDTPDSYKALSLANHLQARGHLPEREAVRIGICVGRALLALHQAGLLHGDVAPGNILSIRSRWVLADPGLVRFLGERGICRNQRYYPQAKPVLPGDDLYAVGVILWEMTSGVMEMVSGRDRVRLDSQMLTFLLRSELPMAKVICRAAAEDPEQRYPTAEEMLQDLETLIARLIPESGTQSALYNLPKLRMLRTNGGLPPLS